MKRPSLYISGSYGLVEWRDDLKTLLRTAGAENKPVVFLFSDVQIVDESFLEDINNILNAGEVPSLFENDEIDQIVGQVTDSEPQMEFCGEQFILDDFT